MKTTLRLSIAALLGAALLAGGAASAAPQFRSDAEASYDGLRRIDNTVLDAAWAKPDIDLSGYTKIMVLPAEVAFKTAPRHSNSTYSLSTEQKQVVRETLLTAFTEALGKNKRYTIVNQPGPDVLMIRGAVLDVVSHVPPAPVGRGGYFLRDLGEATLVVELRDSMSDEILARAVDHRAASSAFVRRSNDVTNRHELRVAAEHWANIANERLEKISSL